MYVVQSLTRIYALVLLCVCSALFSVPALADDVGRFMVETAKKLQSQGKFPANTVFSPSNGGMSYYVPPNSAHVVTSNSGSLVLANGIKSPNFSVTNSYPSTAVRSALGSCVRSPACIGRAVGTAGVIAAGIQGWMDVYDYVVDDSPSPSPSPDAPAIAKLPDLINTNTFVCNCNDFSSVGQSNYYINDSVYYVCTLSAYPASPSVLPVRSNNCTKFSHSGGYFPVAWGYVISEADYSNIKLPLSDSELNQSLGTYMPNSSDVPFLSNYLLNSKPEITLGNISSVSGPSVSSVNKNSVGDVVSTTVTNNTYDFSVTNNSTTSPAISVSNTTVTNTYDESANFIGSQTVTNNFPSQDVAGDSSPVPAPLEFELPSFCSWAESLCDWLNWTKEPLDEEEPDLSTLISEFEPDEGGYSSGIGSGSCPAPMSLNLGIISQTVEVSYQPFCDFLAMIRPLVIAGAWLISAFMYVGVLRRG